MPAFPLRAAVRTIGLAAGALVAADAFAQGRISVVNALPGAARCQFTVSTAAGSFDLPPTVLQANQVVHVHVPPGALPARHDTLPDGTGYSYSPSYRDMIVRCETGPNATGTDWDQYHEITFDDARPDPAQADGSDGESSQAYSYTSSQERQAQYPLTTVTPSDQTGWVIRVVPQHAGVTAADLRLGAPIVAELWALALRPDGNAVQQPAISVGRFPMWLDEGSDVEESWEVPLSGNGWQSPPSDDDASSAS